MGVQRRKKREPLEAPELLISLAAAEEPSVKLEGFLSRLSNVGAVSNWLLGPPDSPVLEEGERPETIFAVGYGVKTYDSIEWEGSTPIADALESVASELERFDPIHRLRLAAIDMDLVVDAANALILARDGGPARFYERTLETGMVVTYARAFTGEARLGDRWIPIGQRTRAALRTCQPKKRVLRARYPLGASNTQRLSGDPGCSFGAPAIV